MTFLMCLSRICKSDASFIGGAPQIGIGRYFEITIRIDIIICDNRHSCTDIGPVRNRGFREFVTKSAHLIDNYATNRNVRTIGRLRESGSCLWTPWASLCGHGYFDTLRRQGELICRSAGGIVDRAVAGTPPMQTTPGSPPPMGGGALSGYACFRVDPAGDIQALAAGRPDRMPSEVLGRHTMVWDLAEVLTPPLSGKKDVVLPIAAAAGFTSCCRAWRGRSPLRIFCSK